MTSAMGAPSSTYCFTCARPVEHVQQVHRLPDGSNCQGCVERLLEALPALLPAREPGSEDECGPAEPWQRESSAFEGPLDPPPDCA